jgi:AraC-like DNA-binding protein
MPADRVEVPTGLADQILSYALASLHDLGLSVGSVGRRYGISPRYLHKLMRDRGIRFGAWVRRERMKRI